MWQASGCTRPQHCNTLPDPWDGSAERHRVGMVDGVVPVDTDVAVSDKVAVTTIRSLRQVANRVLNWSQY